MDVYEVYAIQASILLPNILLVKLRKDSGYTVSEN